MKTNHLSDIKTTASAELNDVKMKMDEESADMLLSSLTHLYSNPILAALREYFSNAYDAQVENKDFSYPIEVTTSSYYKGELCLRIRDYGKGMTEEQLTKLYSQYGASTKRNTNSLVGGFGLGSKSGLAVSDHFYINSVSEGVRNEMKVIRVIGENDNEESVIRPLVQKESDELSGTEIYLPISQENLTELVTHVNQELCGYPPENYLIDGKPNKTTVFNEELFIKVSDNDNAIGYFAKSIPNKKVVSLDDLKYVSKEEFVTQTLNHVHLLMGGVFYSQMPSFSSLDLKKDEVWDELVRFHSKIRNASKVILNLPVGSVKLPPHRDSIIDTKLTWKTLLATISTFNDLIDGTLQSYVDSLPFKEALVFIANHPLNMIHENRNFVWQGNVYSIPGSEPEIGVRFEDKEKDLVAYTNFSSRPAESRPTRLPLQQGFEFFVLAGRHTFPDFREKAPISFIKNVQYEKPYTYEKAVFLHLQLPEEQEQLFFYEWPKEDKTIKGFISRNLKKYAEIQYGTSRYFVLISKGDLPYLYETLIDASITIDEVKEVVKHQRANTVRQAPQSIHGVFNGKYVSPREIQATDNILFFGGKDSVSLLTEDNDILPDRTPVLSTDFPFLKSALTARRTHMLSDNLKNLEYLNVDNNMMVLLDAAKSTKRFISDFPLAVSLGNVIVKNYSQLSSLEQNAVHDAYSMYSLWENPEKLIELISGHAENITNESLRTLLLNKKLLAMGMFLASFTEPYIADYVKFRGSFIEENSQQERAGEKYYPVYILAEKTVSKVSKSANSYKETYEAQHNKRDAKLVTVERFIQYLNRNL